MAAAAAQTSTAVIAEHKEGEHKPVAETITLKLVPRRKKKGERVRWSEDVEEINEFSGKFKSKSRSRMWLRQAFSKAALSVRSRYALEALSPWTAGPRAECCQFHKRRVFGEWSDEDDSDAECDCNNPGDAPQGPPQPTQPL